MNNSEETSSCAENKRLMVFIDGPDILRENYKIKAIDEALKGYDTLIIKKIYLMKYSGEKLIEAVSISGYEPAVCITDDIDTTLIRDATEFILDNDKRYKCDIFALGSGDSDFLPLLYLAKKKGLETFVINLQTQRGSEALRNYAAVQKILELTLEK